MFNAYKRKSNLIIFLLIFILLIFVGGCNNTQNESNGNSFSPLEVNYIDVGEGDATFIKLPDGKTVLIDTGTKSESNEQKIFSLISRYTSKINYFILSHPDSEHYGNALSILENFSVEKIFVPKIINTSVYPEFYSIIQVATQKGIERVISKTFINLSGNDYTLMFLSPTLNSNNQSYIDFISNKTPNSLFCDDMSPIIYLEFLGVKFIFGGDASETQEKMVIDNYKVRLYHSYLMDDNFSLSNIDFYKVSAHGDKRSNSSEFLQLLSPQNAIISVGGGNGLAHPSTEVLLRLEEVNSNYNLYRTDRDKTISVLVDEKGEYIIKKAQ